MFAGVRKLVAAMKEYSVVPELEHSKEGSVNAAKSTGFFGRAEPYSNSARGPLHLNKPPAGEDYSS